MKSIESPTPYLPSSHVESLLELDPSYWWHKARIQWAHKVIEKLSQEQNTQLKSYADVGCGAGKFTQSIDAIFHFQQTHFVDGDRALLQNIPRKKHFHIHEVDLETRWTLPQSVDLVTCMDVIEHLDEDGAFLTNLSAQLKPGSLLVLSVPACPWMYSDWDKQLGHRRRYTHSLLHQRISEAGFQVSVLRYMWSFLAPLALYRRRTSYREQTSFPKTPPLVNSILLWLSQIEWKLPTFAQPAVGSSLIVGAIRK